MPDQIPSPQSLVRADPYPLFGPELGDYDNSVDIQNQFGLKQPPSPSDIFKQKVMGPPQGSPVDELTPDKLVHLIPLLQKRGMDENDIYNYIGSLQRTHQTDEARKAATGFLGQFGSQGITDYLTDPDKRPTRLTSFRNYEHYDPYTSPSGRLIPSEGDIDPRLVLGARDVAQFGFGSPISTAEEPLANVASRFVPSIERSASKFAPVSDVQSASGFPKASFGALATSLTSYPGAAAAGSTPNTRPAFTSEDTKRMNQLESEINNLQKQQQSKVMELGPKKGANAIAGFKSQIDSKQDELNRMRSDMLERQSAYDKASLPISVRNPDAMFKSRAGALGGSLASGVLAGAFSNPKSKWPWLLSAALGGLEGAVGVSAPSLMDLGQPEGTPAREQAEKNLAYISHPTEPGSWDFARNVIAPEALYGAGLGLIGHGIGHNLGTVGRTIGRGLGLSRPTPDIPPAPPRIPSTPSASLPETSLPTGGKVWPSDPRQINMYQDKAGKWREQGTGHFIPRRLLEPQSDQQQIVRALLNKPK